MKIADDICVYIANHIISSLYKNSKFQIQKNSNIKDNWSCVCVGGETGVLSYCLPIEILTSLTNECWLE